MQNRPSCEGRQWKSRASSATERAWFARSIRIDPCPENSAAAAAAARLALLVLPAPISPRKINAVRRRCPRADPSRACRAGLAFVQRHLPQIAGPFVLRGSLELSAQPGLFRGCGGKYGSLAKAESHSDPTGWALAFSALAGVLLVLSIHGCA